jgi:hypothetical protein
MRLNREQPNKREPAEPPRARKAKHRIHLRGVVRVLVYCLFVSVVIAGVSIRSAYGDFKDSSMLIGRQLATFGDLEGSVQRVRLNGEPIYVSSALADASVPELLDRFETACREHAGGLDQMFESLPASIKTNLAGVDGTAGVGIIRNQDGDEGMIACLAQAPLDGWESIGVRTEQFLDTGDLSKIGDLRYVYLKRVANKTHVISVWTDGPFKLFNVAPVDGNEAPGSDSANAPRPLDAVRLLSAEVVGAPYAVRIYDSAESQDEILAMYESEMPKRGWTGIRLPPDEVRNGRAYTREGVDLLVFAFAEGDRSYVSVVEMQPR